ncbi:hypothetical protein [Anaerobacterium chartisolvens]|nr:hypothetical protein [Anaerobacterium chartisolvens]
MAGLNIAIATINVMLFSPGLLNIHIVGANAFATAFGGTAILMSIVLFIYGNYKLLTAKEMVIQTSEIKTTEDYLNALKQHYDKKVFEGDITAILEQIERLQKKGELIKDILLQKFNYTEMSYKKFEGAISAVENVFYINLKSILNKLNAFDEDDYDRIRRKGAEKAFTTEFIQTKMNIYKEYILFVKSSIEDNEQIILKLDKLLLEVSKFNSLEDGEIENMSAIKEIDELTTQTKYYK